jgi:RimJ/RimL family protein N-acetyltransferase
MTFILETERLRLREFTLHDTEFIVALLNSPGWLQFIGDKHIKTAEQARSYLQHGPMKSYVEHGYGLFLVERKADNSAIGMCGIINRQDLDLPDVGFAFLPDFTGNGYALEIVSATISYAQQQLHIPKLLAITLPDNARSIRLLEKSGFHFIRTFRFPKSEEELLLYSN